MSRHAYRLLMILGLSLFVCEAVLTAETPRANFVIVLCDDLGYGDIGCFGHPHIQTPNLDKLAGEGLRLTDCYAAAPVCSPSRCGLLKASVAPPESCDQVATGTSLPRPFTQALASKLQSVASVLATTCICAGVL